MLCHTSFCGFFFFKQKTAYEMRISDWSSDVCSSDLMMAMLRLNVPSIFVYGGSILPGRHQDRDLTVQDVFEVVGRYSSGACPLSALKAIERAACPGHGACGGQFTANTMACVGEAIGLSKSEEHTSELQSLMRISYADV